MHEKRIRRSGIRIMASLIVLLGSLAYVMILAVINGTLGNISAMAVTIFGSLGIAKALGEPIGLSYGWIIALAIGCGAVRGLLRYLEQYSNHYIAFRLLAVLRSKIFGALRRLSPAKLETKEKGSIIAMLTSDIETLEVFYAHTISPICIAILVSVGMIVFIGNVSSWYLAGAAAVGYVLVGIVLPLIVSGKLKETGVAYRRQFARFNAFFMESIQGIQEILLHHNQQERIDAINQETETLLDDTRHMKHTVTRSGAFSEAAVSLVFLGSLILGIHLLAEGLLTPGKLVIGMTAIMSSFGPVLAISALPGNLTQTFASGDRVLNLLEEKPAVLPVENGRDFSFEKMEISHLSFAYDGSHNVLDDVSLQVKKGEIIGIVGPSGCGKSTLLKLCLRFWEKGAGKIAYNGMDVDEIDTHSLLKNVTMVSQNTYLFDESVEENLRIAKPDASREEMEEACRMASIHDFIMSLPQGYQTRIGTLEDNLSSGEKQRLGLARAFLRGSRLILLDEPTSNVDSMNEGMILKALKQQKQEHAIILVSHRESTMAIADRIYRIDQGRLKEEA
jgi:ATP-binding cassette subfamily C protein